MFGEQAVAVYVFAPEQAPPVHTGLLLAGFAEPVKVTLGEAHVIVWVPDTFTVGVVRFWLMV